MKRKRKRYTSQFKAEAMRAVETRGQRTIAEVAAGMGVSDQLVRSWTSKVKAETATSDRRDVLVRSIAAFVKERK